jgi:autotransporter-associated beta strand protein
VSFRRPTRVFTVTVLVAGWVASPAAAQILELTENFTTATQTTGGWTLTSGFWPAQNNSANPQPFGATGGAWGPGGTLFNPAPNNGYFATDTTATGNNNGTVSDWLLTPVLTLHNGDILNFDTRTRSPEEGPSRLEIRLSTAGAGSNVGTLPSDVGTFTQLVGTINPNLVAGAYPEIWAAGQESFTISGLTGVVTGRIAFHTFYPNGGFGGPNGDTVGLAAVTYSSLPTTAWTWTGSTNGGWNTVGNWSPSGVPASNVDNKLTFAATPNAAMTNNIAGVLTINSLNFLSGSPLYSLTGNGLNFQTNGSGALPQIVTNSANSITLGAPLTLTNSLTVSGSGNLSISGAVGGTGGLTNSGIGTVILGNAGNTFSGGVNVLGGTVQAAADSALGIGNVTGGSLGTLAFTGTTATAKAYAMGGGTISVAAGQTVTFNGGPVSSAVLDGAGTFATAAATGARLVNVQSTPSVAINSNNAGDRFVEFDNGAAFSVAAGVVSTSTTNLSGFTNEGLGAVTLGAGSQIEVSNFQSYGTMTLLPAVSPQRTLVTNVGTSPLSLNGGSRTFIGTPQTASQFVAGMDLNGQNLIVAGGLFVNNGFVGDSSSAGTGTIVADFGSLVKGAGFFQNPVITQNGGKFQAGNSPGTASFGSLTLGPGAINNLQWQINDAGPSSTFPSSGATAGGRLEGESNNVSGWSLLVSRVLINPLNNVVSSGNFTWTATSAPGGQFTISLETLLGPVSAIGTNNDGPMADFDPSLKYVWPFIEWQRTYSGPTSDQELTADTLFDTSQFANAIPAGATFSLHLIQNAPGMGGEIDLVYSPVPEPGVFGLMAVGLVAVGRHLRRKRRRNGISGA